MRDLLEAWSHLTLCVLSPQTCCVCSSTPCTTRMSLRRRPSTSGNPAKTPQSKRARAWPWNLSPPSSPGCVRLRRSPTRSKKKEETLNWNLFPPRSWQANGSALWLQRRKDNTAKGEDSKSILSEDKSYLYLWGMDSDNNHFSLPSISCFLIISPPAYDSKCPRQINLKTELLEVWSVPHHYQTLFFFFFHSQ